MVKTHRAVFLDRDGVLNRAVVKNGKPYPPASLSELMITTDARDALVPLRDAGFLLVGITNQPDVARGVQQRAVVEAINRVLLGALPLNDILVCFHDDRDNCLCRKPRPGLLREAASRYTIDLSRSFMVGDRWRDIEAGSRAGCKTVFIDCEYSGEKLRIQPDHSVKTLTEAARWIIGQVPDGEVT